MAVLERPDLEASSLADLHAIADQLGLDGFRRLRKSELIEAILGQAPPDAGREQEPAGDERRETERAPARRSRRSGRAARARSQSGGGSDEQEGTDDDASPSEAQRRGRSGAGAIAEGVVEVLGNGSAFLRVSPPDPSDEDIYISAAQVRRCELVTGDRVSGPVRTPRRSERYPSLVRIEAINGDSADALAGQGSYEELAAAFPTARLALGSSDPTLAAIEWLTPIGRGSRVTICGGARAGKTTTLRHIADALAGQDDLQLTLVLAGARPEEIADWQQAEIAPAAALTFGASADAQSQAVERAVEVAKRAAARGSDAVVLIDSLDGLHVHSARRALAAARNLRDAGSLTLLATASRPLGGESTVITLDAVLTSTGRQPILDLLASGTLRPELLVGDEGARAIAAARAASLDEAP